MTHVFIQGQFPESTKRHVLVRPNLGDVENVPLELLDLLWIEHLNIAGPAGEILILNGIKQILRMMIWIFGLHLLGLVVGEILDALISLNVDLNVFEGAILAEKLVRVSRIAVHCTIRERRATVTEKL